MPSVADPSNQQMMTPTTLLDCCRCAQELVDEYDLADGLDVGELTIMRALGHQQRALSQKHDTDVKRSFLTRAKAMDKAKRMKLTPDQACGWSFLGHGI